MQVISPQQAGVASLPVRGDDRKALDNWQNEGGHLSASAAERVKHLAAVASEGETLRDKAASFLSDFANGRVGQHHNTYQHRTRVLRQLTARWRETAQAREAVCDGS